HRLTLSPSTNATPTTPIYTLSLHERSSDLKAGLSSSPPEQAARTSPGINRETRRTRRRGNLICEDRSKPSSRGARKPGRAPDAEDRKSTRLNSSHVKISYAVFCLKKKKNTR